MATVPPTPDPELILRHLRESAEQARAAKQVVWRLYESHLSSTLETQVGTNPPVSSYSWNPGVPVYRKYRDFFDIIELSLLHTMVLAIYRIFEHGEEHASVYNYLECVKQRLGDARVKDFKRRLQPLRETAEQLRSARHQFAAHLRVDRTADEALKESVPFKLVTSQFLDDLAAILNELRDEAGIEQQNQVTTDDSYAEAARGVLSVLIYRLRRVDEDGLVRMRQRIPEP